MKCVGEQVFNIGSMGTFFKASGTSIDYAKSIGIEYTYWLLFRPMIVSYVSQRAKEIEIFADTVAQAVTQL